MPDSGPDFTVKIAETEAELRAAQALRYQVFVQELGAGGDLVDHQAGLERDRFDPFFDHMICTDTRSGAVIGVYRLLRDDQAVAAGQFYSEDEYDLSVLKASGRKLLELGRSCLHPEYRGGTAMFHLWNGLAAYVAEHGIEVLFGTASFHGTDIAALAQPLSMLHHNHLAPPELRVRAQPAHFQTMDLVPVDRLDRRSAMVQVPALIKAYLRLGGFVGEGAFVDQSFNTTDVCLVLDTARMNDRQRRIYSGSRSG
ncbi:GNAT family N-acetyltransferase [Pseudodonghicola flavimaris]|uniref:L-ornithine N(alpha)-acyltransferase n=1 Tax=Pseudodonghicola flavimaris TaxID=3050036 RepID=A0ABT7F0X6_9RHOB|nr:GNAT family N-acyltransferase [Pseudodonghicola flavimaris]MDK3018244.1 GNAT family N-acyltransferase [Pseudodonghicola flavimaris]